MAHFVKNTTKFAKIKGKENEAKISKQNQWQMKIFNQQNQWQSHHKNRCTTDKDRLLKKKRWLLKCHCRKTSKGHLRVKSMLDFVLMYSFLCYNIIY